MAVTVPAPNFAFVKSVADECRTAGYGTTNALAGNAGINNRQRLPPEITTALSALHPRVPVPVCFPSSSSISTRDLRSGAWVRRRRQLGLVTSQAQPCMPNACHTCVVHHPSRARIYLPSLPSVKYADHDNRSATEHIKLNSNYINLQPTNSSRAPPHLRP